MAVLQAPARSALESIRHKKLTIRSFSFVESHAAAGDCMGDSNPGKQKTLSESIT